MTPARARHPPPDPGRPGERIPGGASIALIVAVAANGVIGAGNRLPWRLPADLRHFRAVTTGHAVVMGRRTWESLPRALPDRQNIVVTRNAHYVAPGAQVVDSLDAAMAVVALPAPVFCIGGGELYRAALPRADTVYLTAVARDYPGDVSFPALDPRQWVERGREDHAATGPEEPGFSFVTLQRRRLPPA